MSRDKKKVAKLIIEKTETLTSLYLDITIKGVVAPKIKLFDKKNTWWYDCTYILLRHNKWLDIDRFGISYKGVIEIWYSIEENEITFYENKSRVTEIDFKKFFLFN